MSHLTEGLLAGLCGQLGKSPTGLQFGVQEILIDCGQLARQLLVQQDENLFVAAHSDHPLRYRKRRPNWIKLQSQSTAGPAQWQLGITVLRGGAHRNWASRDRCSDPGTRGDVAARMAPPAPVPCAP